MLGLLYPPGALRVGVAVRPRFRRAPPSREAARRSRQTDLPGDRHGYSGESATGGRFSESSEAHVRAQSVENWGASKDLAARCSRPGMQRQERGNKISAVNRRDEGRGIETAAGFECRTSCRDGRGISPFCAMVSRVRPVSAANSGAGDESQLARSLTRVQQQPDIGGRNARRLAEAPSITLSGIR